MKKLIFMSMLLLSPAFASQGCLKLILGDIALGVSSSKEAVKLCLQYPLSIIECAQGLDNDNIEIDFYKGLKVCSATEHVNCVKTILQDIGLGVSSSKEALAICSYYPVDTIKCAQDLDNSGLEGNFYLGLNACNQLLDQPTEEIEVVEEVEETSIVTAH